MEHGLMINEECYRKILHPKHFMIKYKGFGISYDILKKLEKCECHLIQIIYMGKNGRKILYSTLKQWLDSNKTFNFNGADLQHFVSMCDMIEC